MIRKFPVKSVTGNFGKPCLVNEKACLECGCDVLVGIVVGEHQSNGRLEAAVIASSCGQGHEPIMQKFGELIIASLDNPQPKRLVEVVDELLQEAHNAVLSRGIS